MDRVGDHTLVAAGRQGGKMIGVVLCFYPAILPIGNCLLVDCEISCNRKFRVHKRLMALWNAHDVR